MCVLLALLLCRVIPRWHGMGFTAMCTQCKSFAIVVYIHVWGSSSIVILRIL